MKIQYYFIACMLLALCACKPSTQSTQFSATDVSGTDFAQALSLTDHTGKRRQLDEFKGKVTTVFFGYTHCPDVCPTTMADMKQVMKLLGKRAEEVQVLFVTLDPERDTQEILAQYVPGFDPRFIGLRGTQEETAKVASDFKIFMAKVDNSGKSGYTIDHSSGLYIYDKTGKIRLYVPYGEKPAVIAADIQKLL